MTPVAIITGASRGLGRATAQALAHRGWDLVIDARGSDALRAVAEDLASTTTVEALTGDVTDAAHRAALVSAAAALGGPHLLMNNASMLGPSPQPFLADYPVDVFRRVHDVNVMAPLALIAETLPFLRERDGWVINVTSDAAVEDYPGWGGYGSSKAALDHLSRILASEEPSITVLSYDPGDMNTAMHQEAFPGQDISDRPPPEDSVPALLALIDEHRPSGRYRASDVAEVT